MPTPLFDIPKISRIFSHIAFGYSLNILIFSRQAERNKKKANVNAPLRGIIELKVTVCKARESKI
jgi:hypothetical protein